MGKNNSGSTARQAALSRQSICAPLASRGIPKARVFDRGWKAGKTTRKVLREIDVFIDPIPNCLYILTNQPSNQGIPENCHKFVSPDTALNTYIGSDFADQDSHSCGNFPLRRQADLRLISRDCLPRVIGAYWRNQLGGVDCAFHFRLGA